MVAEQFPTAMVERVDVPVLQDVEQSIDMPVPLNGRWVSDTGGDAESNKKSIASVARLKRKADLAGKLAESCPSKPLEREDHRKSSVGEHLAIHGTIEWLIDDDVIKLFEATLPSSWVQVHQSTIALARRVAEELRRSSRTPSKSASNLKLIKLSHNQPRFSRCVRVTWHILGLLLCMIIFNYCFIVFKGM